MAKGITVRKSKPTIMLTQQACSLCGSSVTLQSGIKRCSNRTCGHVQGQSAGAERFRYTSIPESKYPEYEPIIPRAVDKEMR